MGSRSKIENWLSDWWLGKLSDTQRRLLRIIICLIFPAIPAVAFHFFTGDFRRIPDIHLLGGYLLGIILSFIFSIVWTRETRYAKELDKANELISQESDKLLEAYQKLKEVNSELRNISNHDQLTGLHSRHYLEENKPRIIAEARRHGWFIWAIMIDLNKLKYINDAFGHDAGDGLLCYYSQSVKNMLRDTDHCIRLGGDEILIIGSDPNHDAALTLVERILKDMDSWSFEIKGITIKVTAAIGFANKQLVRGCTATLEDIIKIADSKMYTHKTTGKLAESEEESILS